MKKRYVDANRLRKMRRLKITEKLSEAYTFLKFMVMWTLVLLADFILEFRLEYLWPCWLFFGSVYTTFHCHGLVICVVFVCAAFTLDIFCLIFVPLHWLFFVASTYVLFNYIWHTKGICISTVSLWILLVYTEASLRLKDLNTSHPNLSHLFAAHIGYPVVYLGFDATCYFTNIFKLRIQKAVQSENDFHMHLLQHSLPPGLQVYSKTNLPQEDQGSKATRAAKSASPKARRSNTNTPSPPAGRPEKKQRTNSKTISPNLEAELRRLKGELQTSRQSEQELRSHICNLTNSERSLRPEVSLLRQSNMLLQSILCLTKTKQRDKQTSALLEKKTRAEAEGRLSAEKQLAELQAQKLEEAANAARTLTNQEHCETQMLRKRVKDLETEYKQLQLEYQVKESRVVDLERDIEALGKYRCVEKETDMLLSTLSAMQEKAQHLEYNLSAETRIKLDLFSALGDARRQLEIAQKKQDREIREMKQKIAEVMAVSPGVSYVAPRPQVPQYLTKLLNSERYMLNPRALMYQCLKK
uniref:Si:dkey-12h9.6 n=1 Tax=Poecilia reticulata TaxID=8081 RepID=A0A3P9NME8_POERE